MVWSFLATCSSSRAIRWLTADWVRCSFSAAPEKEPVSATVKNAFKFYEYRKEKTLPGEKLKEVNAKIKSNEWEGENLDNKTILNLYEQGIGDNIQFFRYLYWINEKYNVDILFYTDEKISHLFKNSPFKIITTLDNLDHVDFHKLLLHLVNL